eukprot:Nk52_evm26s225 gene=Nk52_evmTU26s225
MNNAKNNWEKIPKNKPNDSAGRVDEKEIISHKKKTKGVEKFALIVLAQQCSMQPSFRVVGTEVTHGIQRIQGFDEMVTDAFNENGGVFVTQRGPMKFQLASPLIMYDVLALKKVPKKNVAVDFVMEHMHENSWDVIVNYFVKTINTKYEDGLLTELFAVYFNPGNSQPDACGEQKEGKASFASTVDMQKPDKLVITQMKATTDGTKTVKELLPKLMSPQSEEDGTYLWRVGINSQSIPLVPGSIATSDKEFSTENLLALTCASMATDLECAESRMAWGAWLVYRKEYVSNLLATEMLTKNFLPKHLETNKNWVQLLTTLQEYTLDDCYTLVQDDLCDDLSLKGCGMKDVAQSIDQIFSLGGNNWGYLCPLTQKQIKSTQVFTFKKYNNTIATGFDALVAMFIESIAPAHFNQANTARLYELAEIIKTEALSNKPHEMLRYAAQSNVYRTKNMQEYALSGAVKRSNGKTYGKCSFSCEFDLAGVYEQPKTLGAKYCSNIYVPALLHELPKKNNHHKVNIESLENNVDMPRRLSVISNHLSKTLSNLKEDQNEENISLDISVIEKQNNYDDTAIQNIVSRSMAKCFKFKAACERRLKGVTFNIIGSRVFTSCELGSSYGKYLRNIVSLGQWKKGDKITEPTSNEIAKLKNPFLNT